MLPSKLRFILYFYTPFQPTKCPPAEVGADTNQAEP